MTDFVGRRCETRLSELGLAWLGLVYEGGARGPDHVLMTSTLSWMPGRQSD
jgi:hypothetical protein